MAYPDILILEPLEGESDAAQASPLAWLLEAARTRLLPPQATWFGPSVPAEVRALQMLRRVGWAGTPARGRPLPPGWRAPLLLLHPDAAADTLAACLARAAQQARQRHVGGAHFLLGDGSVRFVLIGLLLPAVQKISAAYPHDPKAARYPLHLHASMPAPPGAPAWPGTVVLAL
jgi:prepilin-type processing-associated H-X9-DG protein